MPAKTNLRLVKPAIQKRAVAPLRRPNSEFRSREHLTETEVEKLIEAAKDNRYGHRDGRVLHISECPTLLDHPSVQVLVCE